MGKSTTPQSGKALREYSQQEGLELFDRAARQHLGLSGTEFLKRWDAGDFADDPDRPEVLEVAMLIPLVR